VNYQKWCEEHSGEAAYSSAIIPEGSEAKVEVNPKLQLHKKICADLLETYRKKNEAYGDSFGKTYRELGPISAITRMADKMNRIIALAQGARNEVTDESLADSVRDLANYSIMFLIEMGE
jgi:hypothetical protein